MLTLCVCDWCLRMCLWSSLKFCSFGKLSAWFLLSSPNCSSASASTSAKSQRFVNEIIEVSTGSGTGTGSCWCVSQVLVPKVSSMKNNWLAHIHSHITHTYTHTSTHSHTHTHSKSFLCSQKVKSIFIRHFLYSSIIVLLLQRVYSFCTEVCNAF